MRKNSNYIATPPGATIKEQLVDRAMNQKEFAVRMGMSEKHISKLVNGEVQLTMDVARRLEMVLGVPAQFWCNLESIYREKLAKMNEETEMNVDVTLVKKFPYKEMARHSWVDDVSKGTEQAMRLRKYFEVTQLKILQNHLVPAGIACRKSSESELSYYALVAWAQKAKLEARKIDTKPINVKKLIIKIPEIRKMTIMPMSKFCVGLQRMLADCGIALVLLPYIGGSFLHGATFYDGHKIVLGLTVNGKDADEFWFSLFHELGHIVLGHIDKAEGTTAEDEDAADAYAEDILIPKVDFVFYTDADNISEKTIIEFAEKEGISAGIVLGRLQKYGYVMQGMYDKLKVKYQPSA